MPPVPRPIVSAEARHPGPCQGQLLCLWSGGRLGGNANQCNGNGRFRPFAQWPSRRPP